jgi:hypothetical protein
VFLKDVAEGLVLLPKDCPVQSKEQKVLDHSDHHYHYEPRLEQNGSRRTVAFSTFGQITSCELGVG